jgi:glycosyltransferase involved in cell wall biosynthesis
VISVIVCGRSARDAKRHRRHIARTIGCEHEYVRIDNSEGRKGLCAAYNEGVRQAGGHVLVFIHDDVYVLEKGWGRRLEERFAGDSGIGLVGVAGTQLLLRHNSRWGVIGPPYIASVVFHEYGLMRFPRVDDLRRRYVRRLGRFPYEPYEMEAVAVDGLFLAMPRRLFESVSWDEEVFDGYHLYDADICMQVRRTHRIIVMADLLVKHKRAHGNRPHRNVTTVLPLYQERFTAKYWDELPASCVPLADVLSTVRNAPPSAMRDYRLRTLASELAELAKGVE